MEAVTRDDSLPPEFVLACACAMWPPSERRSRAVLAAARAPIDWERFVRVAQRHRIVGLAHEALRNNQVELPPAVAQTLSDAVVRQTHHNLFFAREFVRLARAFEKQGLGVTFFKGLPTALEIYGNLGIRESKDIDVLVTRDDVERADEVLRAAGYRRVDPPESVDPARVRTLLRIAKDFIYTGIEEEALQVELHWRLFKNATFMPALARSAREQVIAELDNIRIRTFVGDDQFAYLCAHGAAYAWCRLKWLADIGAWLARGTPEETVRLYRAAVARGAGRPAAQAILLCERLLGTALPPGFSDELRHDSGVRKLEALAMTAMLQGDGVEEPYDLPGGMRPIVKSEWLLGGTLRYRWGELNTRWISWDDVVNVPLPAGLQFLYPLLRVPLWLVRRFSATRS